MNEFLKTEFDNCMSLIKFYDEKQFSLVKYSVGLSSGIPAFLIAVFRFGSDDLKAQMWTLTGLVSLMTFFGLLILYVVLVQNRLYFVYPARQINSIRKSCIEKMEDENKFQNQMYVSTNFNAWKWNSSHTLLMLFVALQLGIFLGLSIYSFNYSVNEQTSQLCIAGSVSLLFSIIIFLIAAKYLSVTGKASADKSIHR